MDEEIRCITKKKRKNGYEWMEKWWLWHSSSFIQSIQKLGQSFSHTYSLTCLDKDTPVLLKVKNIWTSS